jgi:hypothetical protein
LLGYSNLMFALQSFGILFRQSCIITIVVLFQAGCKALEVQRRKGLSTEDLLRCMANIDFYFPSASSCCHYLPSISQMTQSIHDYLYQICVQHFTAKFPKWFLKEMNLQPHVSLVFTTQEHMCTFYPVYTLKKIQKVNQCQINLFLVTQQDSFHHNFLLALAIPRCGINKNQVHKCNELVLEPLRCFIVIENKISSFCQSLMGVNPQTPLLQKKTRVTCGGTSSSHTLAYVK